VAAQAIQGSYLLEVNAPMYLERMAAGGLGLPSLARWTERVAWRTADLVLPVSEVLAGYLVAEGVAKQRIAVVPNGINLQTFADAPTTNEAKRALGLEGELVLGFTGFVRSWHGLDRVIDLIANSPRRYFLLVVGDGPAREQLEVQARRLRVADRVRFTGVVARERIPDYVAAFDIALQPASALCITLKLFEYMVLGRAIVATRQPNICEVLQHGRNALLFDPARNADLAQAIDRLAADPEERGRLSEAARRTIVEGDYTWARNARRVVKLGEMMLAGTPASARG
jgi:glycosyltransferase involved in cell wall biosynthesis